MYTRPRPTPRGASRTKMSKSKTMRLRTYDEDVELAEAKDVGSENENTNKVDDVLDAFFDDSAATPPRTFSSPKRKRVLSDNSSPIRSKGRLVDSPDKGRHVVDGRGGSHGTRGQRVLASGFVKKKRKARIDVGALLTTPAHRNTRRHALGESDDSESDDGDILVTDASSLTQTQRTKTKRSILETPRVFTRRDRQTATPAVLPRNVSTPVHPKHARNVHTPVLSTKSPVTERKRKTSRLPVTPPSARLKWELFGDDSAMIPATNTPQQKTKRRRRRRKKALDEEGDTDILRQQPTLSRKEILESLVLPSKFQLLLNFFDALETCMSLHMARGRFFVEFNSVKTSVERITKRTFSLESLRQILYLVPALFGLKWLNITNKYSKRTETKLGVFLRNHAVDDENEENDDSNKSGKRKLEKKGNGLDESAVGIKFMNHALSIQRKEIFCERLRMEVIAKHNEWVATNSIVSWDVFTQGGLHNRFPLDSVVDVDLTDLPPKTETTSGLTADEMLNRGKGTRLESTQVSRALASALKSSELDNVTNAVAHVVSKEKTRESTTTEESASEKKDAREESTEFDLSKVPKHMRHLDPKMLARVYSRGKVQKVLKKTLDTEENSERGEWERLPYLVNLIRSICVTKKKSAMPHSSLIQALESKHRDCLSGARIQSQLDLLSGLTSKFFYTKQTRTRNVKIAKINMKVDPAVVKREIQSKLDSFGDA